MWRSDQLKKLVVETGRRLSEGDGGVPQTYKPGFVFFPKGKIGDHLSSPLSCLAAGESPLLAERRYRRGQAANPGTSRAPMSPYLALLQVGFSRRCVTADGRTLLPSDFTLIPTSRDGMFLCHFPFPTPANRNRDLGVTQHPAQRSPDFPPSRQVGTAVTRSAWPSISNSSIGVIRGQTRVLSRQYLSR